MNRSIENEKILMLNYGYGMILDNFIGFPIHIFNQLYLLKKLLNPPAESYKYKEPTPKATLTLKKEEIDFFKRFFNSNTKLVKKDIEQMINILKKRGMKVKSVIKYRKDKCAQIYLHTTYTGCKFIKTIVHQNTLFDSNYRFNSCSITDLFNRFDNEPLYTMQNKSIYDDDRDSDAYRVTSIVDDRDYFLGNNISLNLKADELKPYLDIHKCIFCNTILYALKRFLKAYVFKFFLLKLNKHLSFRGKSDYAFYEILKSVINGAITFNDFIINSANDVFKSDIFRLNYKSIIAVNKFSHDKINDYFLECLIDKLRKNAN